MEQEEKQIQKRRLEDTLYICGNGVMAFGLWSLIQLLAYLTVRRNELEAVSAEAGGFPVWGIMLILTGFVFIELLFRLYVGLSARAVAKGKKKKGYVILSIIVMIVYYIPVNAFILINPSETGLIRYLVEALVVATSLFMYGQLIYAGIKIKKL